MRYRSPAILAFLLIVFIFCLLVVINFDELHLVEQEGLKTLPVPNIAILYGAQKFVRRGFGRQRSDGRWIESFDYQPYSQNHF